MPSSVGILVYREVTSSVHRRQSFGRGVDSMKLMKSLLSFMYEGRDCAIGWSQWSIYAEMFSMGSLHPDTIGLSAFGVLCILVRKYSSCVLVGLGGRRYSAVGLSILVHGSDSGHYSAGYFHSGIVS